MEYKVLVVEDERTLLETLEYNLAHQGYQVFTAENGRDGLDIARSELPDLIVLDLMLPGIDGFEVCRILRRELSVPIIMLTARSEEVDKIVGLEMGADDYLTKPFNPRELVARVRAILRRAAPASDAGSPKVRQVGDVVLDPSGREVTVRGERITLRTKEFDLLLTLMDHLNMVLSRDQLLDQVWGYEFYGRTRTVDMHMANLREKLAGSALFVETVWGKGYKLVLTEEGR